MSADNKTEFNKLLGNISSKTPILFFPLRIETHFRKKLNKNELCVRIFPDEIFLDYLTETLTEEENNDAKSFWTQWYIASGNSTREYEAWQALCAKYPVYRAAWLVRRLKPEYFSRIRKTPNFSERQPFNKMPEIERNIKNIYNNLPGSRLTVSAAKKIEDSLRNIDNIVKEYKDIVDYIYDNITEVVEHTVKSLDNFLLLSGKKRRSSSGKSDTLSTTDILGKSNEQIIDEIKETVNSLLKNIEGKRITLKDLIKKYLEDPHLGFTLFDVTLNDSDKPNFPVSNILPDRFVFIGEAANKPNNKIIQFGNKVKENLPMGIDPNDTSGKNIYEIDKAGDLKVSGGIDWMIDYDKAEAAGMAITVPLDSNINEFTYVYVLGINNTVDNYTNEQHLINLLNSHNYSSPAGMAMLKTASPSNIVEGMEPAYNYDRETEMKIRYDIEVNEIYDNPDAVKYDSMTLAKALNMSAYYENCFGNVANFDNREIDNAKEAYKIMWDYFFDVLTKNKTTGKYSHPFLNQMGDFMKRYVRARGPYPAFRIDNKPYSILPVCNLKKLPKTNSTECPDYLLKSLKELADKWKKVRKNWVVHSENLKGNTTGKKFLEMAGQTPYSTTFYERTLLNSPLLPPDKWYPSAMKKHFDLMHRYGFFDPWPIGGSEEEISFKDQNSQLSKALGQLKSKMPKGHNLSDDELKLLVAEFYDIFTHRLDAWITGVFENIRETYCKETPMIGAYGWVFNLKKTDRDEIDQKAKDKIKELKLLPENVLNSQKIYQNTGGEGYIVAPSVQHATTAAVLRAAYLKTQKNKEDSHLCINLSSMRTRQALRMIDGIKQGISTSVVLGADLERYLHEAWRTGNEMDQYIYPLRVLFPQVISLQAEDERAHDHAMQVINGEALLNTFVEEWANNGSVSSWLETKYNNDKQGECIKWFIMLEKETGITSAHRKCLFKLIERLVDSYDALNDLLLAEGVHRLVLGDTASYSAINNFMAEGKGNLPDLAVLDTPMEYVVFSNKTGIALPECKTQQNKPMCIAEPSINMWIEQLIGKLDNILFYIEITTRKIIEGEPVTEVKYEACTLNELDIKPAEYLYLSSNETLFLKYLEVRWRLKFNCFAEKIKILTNKPAEYKEDIISFNEKGEAISDLFTLYEDELRISKLRSIVTQSPAMKAIDFVPSAHGDYDMETAIDVNELKSRYVSLRGYLAQLSADMKLFIEQLEDLERDMETDAFNDAVIAEIYENLCRCTASGMLNSLPEFDTELFVYNIRDNEKQYHLNPIVYALDIIKSVEKQQAFIEKYKFAYEELNKRISEAENTVELVSSDTYTAGQYVEAIKMLLLSNFKVCPRFTLHPALTQDERKAVDAVIKKGISCYKNLNELSFDEWQFDVAEVRELMKTWHHLSLFQSVGNGDTGKISILQTNSDGAPLENLWLGCKVEREADLQDVDSLVIYNSEDFTELGTDNPVFNSGLIIDAWNEFIPYKKQTAGMVFNCDQPDNEAPQALLLAMSPNCVFPTSKWKEDEILDLLDFTRFMLMNRAVEPDHIYKDKQLSRLFPLLSNKELTRDYINS